jgi:hypothetical protein
MAAPVSPSGRKVVALLAAASLAVAACGGGKAKVASSNGVKGASEIMAEPVSSAGNNPFTAPAGTDMSGVKPPPKAVSTSGPATYRGSLPGLYGGTRDYASCDAHKLVTFLEHEPSKAAAWASVLGIRVTEIRGYVRRLTPVILRTDTRVTNHGYASGRATVIQSVLQAGTAVFVNRYGEPVVKCYCGNPLTPPALYREPVYIGPRWTGFSTTHITIIQQSITIIDVFKLYDPDTGTIFKRKAGGPCCSGDTSSATTPNLPPPSGNPPPPSGNPPPQPQQPQQQSENPSASFSPNPGHQGDNFTLSVSGFRPGSNLAVTLMRPDGVVEHYAIGIGGDGGGSRTFGNTGNVITGTYSATVTNPSTGATAHASVQVLQSGTP